MLLSVQFRACLRLHFKMGVSNIVIVIIHHLFLLLDTNLSANTCFCCLPPSCVANLL